MRLARLVLYLFLGLALGVTSSLAFALTINLPTTPPSGCASGAFACANPVSPKIQDSIDTVVVSAPRLNPDGSVATVAPTVINSSVSAAASASCVNVPAGWGTSGSGSSCTITPPASAAVITGQFGTNASGNPIWCSAGNYCASSRLATCQTFAQNQNLAGGGYYGELNGTGSACNLYNNSSKTVFIYSTPVSPAVNCPTGYVQTGNAATNPSCVVTTNAALKLTIQKPVDGKCTIIRTGNSYAADAYDADCTSSGAPTVTPSKIESKTPDGSAAAVPNSDGSTTITYSQYNYTNSTTTTTTITYGADNKVAGVATTTTEGIGGAGTGAPVAQTTGASSADIAANTAAVNAAAAAAAAAATTAAAKADALKAAVDKVEDDVKPSTNTGAPSQPGALYTSSGKTMSGIIGSFVSTVQAQAFYQAATGFFTVTLPAGSCPTWSVHAWVFDVVIDQQCSSVMQSIWPYISAIIIACASFLAFRWAFL